MNLASCLWRIGFRVRFDHGGVSRAKFGIRLFQCGSGSKPPEELGHAMNPPRDHRSGEMVRTGDYVGDDLGLCRVRHRGFEDSDDRRVAVPQANSLTDHRGIALERGRPEAIGQNAGAGGVRTIVVLVQQTSENRTQPHHLEVRASNHSGAHFARLTQSHHGEADLRKVSDGADRLQADFEVLNFRHGEHSVGELQPRCALPGVNQVAFVAVDQRAQQHPAHQAEDRRVRTNAQRQRQNDGDRQPLRPPQRPKRHLQVLQD